MIIEIATWLMYFVSVYFAVFLLLVVLDKGISGYDYAVNNKKAYRWKPCITVGIPAINEEQTIRATMESVLNLHYPRNKMQIIVVDDGSNDKTPQIVRQVAREHPSVDIKFIQHSVNKGKGAALNTALHAASGEIFICLDADSFVQPNALTTILPYFYGRATVASVLPFMKITRTDNFMLKIQWVEYLMNFFLKRIMGALDCIHVTPGPFASYRKEVLLKVGGFDEHNLTEDLEMAIRLQKYQYKIIQLLDAEVYTVPPDTLFRFYKQRNRWYKGTLQNLYKHRDLMFNRHYGEFGLFHLPMVLTSAILSLGFAFLILYQRFLQPAFTRLYDLSFIDFNMPLMLRVGAQRFNILDFNYTLLYLTVIIFAFALMWIIGSHRYSKESYLHKGLVPSFFFLAVYPLILSIIWMGVFFDLIRNKRQKW